MKYGILYDNGARETFEGREAAGEAREALIVARGCMSEGETVCLFSQGDYGPPVTLEVVRQPRIVPLTQIFAH